MLLLAVAGGNFTISSVGRVLGHSSCGSVVQIPSGEVDLSSGAAISLANVFLLHQ